MTELITPENGALLSVMTPLQKEFASCHPSPDNGEFDRRLKAAAEAHTVDLSRPASAIFSWKCDDPTAPMTLEISENEDFDVPAPVSADKVRQSAEDGTYFAAVTNFFTGRKYFWRVRCGDGISETRAFSTREGEIRSVSVDRVPNFRDLGGKVTADGRLVKQGMLYRGTHPEYDDDGNGITASGRETFIRELGIKTELDLREESLGKVLASPVGEEVRFFNVGFDSCWGGTLNDRGMGQIKEIFDVLCDESNYPVFFHCAAGADRTGFLSVVIESILGVPERDIILDYEYTSLYEERDWDTNEGVLSYFGFLDEKYPGHDCPELVRIHMKEYGVDPSVFGKLRKILLEDK